MEAGRPGRTWRHGATPWLDNMVLLTPNPAWVATLPGGKLPQVGDMFRNPELAWTYRQIAAQGSAAARPRPPRHKQMPQLPRSSGVHPAPNLQGQYRAETVAKDRARQIRQAFKTVSQRRHHRGPRVIRCLPQAILAPGQLHGKGFHGVWQQGRPAAKRRRAAARVRDAQQPLRGHRAWGEAHQADAHRPLL